MKVPVRNILCLITVNGEVIYLDNSELQNNNNTMLNINFNEGTLSLDSQDNQLNFENIDLEQDHNLDAFANELLNEFTQGIQLPEDTADTKNQKDNFLPFDFEPTFNFDI